MNGCQGDLVGDLEGSGRNHQLVGGVVKLPGAPSYPQAFGFRPATEWNLKNVFFAKSGIFYRGDATFSVKVEEPHSAWVGWHHDKRAQPFREIRVRGCKKTDQRWRAMPGGYFVRQPTCMTLIVTTGTATERVSVGVGKGCPGQANPP